MRRAAWGLILALVLGVGIGLGYAWVISPHPITNAPPNALRMDFKDQYRSLIAAAYAATGNLPRAQARLGVLGDADPIEALNAQAQRMLASPQTFERAEYVAALASALEAGISGMPVRTPTVDIPINAGNTFTPTSPSSLTDLPVLLSETPELIETQTAVVKTESTQRPTQTPTPVPGRPFALTAEETVCDANLPDGLLQVMVLNRNRRQVAGVEIVITWDSGKEQFFTGLKPELGNGYADYQMTPDTTYTVQLARGSDVALGITPPTCQTPDGATFLGSIKLTFQQP
ncbi:MAG TPA: hypothetical protein VJ830_06200 [Anaerolineales bacterium]|nr:hypothetical protein [Anaerolineales bacterium]